MDIAGLSMAMSQSKALGDIGTAVLSKQLDNMEIAGSQMAASLAAMPSPSLESMVLPGVGGNIDMLV